MHQRGLHLWELDMSWVSGPKEIEGSWEKEWKLFLSPFSSSFPFFSSALHFFFCHEDEIGSWRITYIYRPWRIQRIPSYEEVQRWRGIAISAPPLSPRLSTYPSSHLSSGAELTTPIVKWQQYDPATWDCFARFKSFERVPIAGLW